MMVSNFIQNDANKKIDFYKKKLGVEAMLD